MKRIITTALLIFALATGHAQDIVHLFTKASKFCSEYEYDSAYPIFEKIFKYGKGDESLIAKSYYNMAFIHFGNEEYDKARLIFENILDSDFDEMDKGGRGEGVMAELYALYKNNSCKHLAEIALEEKNYARALYYTELFDKIHPYKHYCGNEYAANDIYVAYTYARCYDGLGKRDKAIATLLPLSMYNGLAHNGNLVHFADSLIKMRYSKVEIRLELEKAVASIHIKKKRIRGQLTDQYYTTIFGTSTRLYGYNEDWKDDTVSLKMEDDESYKYVFMNSNFYKTLLK
jgi:tetratricopeptide (TPR) repeat protein